MKERNPMFENIVQSIICSEFQQRFTRNGEYSQGSSSSTDKAMHVKFSLSTSYAIEEGYRNLHILIFGGGSNYISVFAKLDWNVTPISDEENEPEYTQGQTPWVFYGCHDSCWRDAVHIIIWEFRERISSIDWVFGGWYKITPMEDKYLEDSRNAHYKKRRRQSSWQKVSELEFHFDIEKNNPA